MRPACPPHDLSLYAYGFLEVEECAAVDAHLASCPRCREAAERLQRESEIVAFELGVEAGLAVADETPAPVVRPVRRLRRTLRIAAAAAVLVAVSLAAWFVVRPDGPREAGWTPLPDGSRYRIVDRAEVAGTQGLRRMELAAGTLVLDVVDDESEFEVATPHGTVRSGEARYAVSVADGTTLVEVMDGRVRLEPAEGARETVVEGDGREVHVLVVEVVRDPELLARIAELEARLRELGEAVDEPGDGAPLPADEAIERHDWSALARTLLETAGDARGSRLPGDPVVRRRYLRRLGELGRLADALGIEPSVEAIARDPRAGPHLVAATVERLWPDAPPADVDRVRLDAADALRRYADATSVAGTSAERNAAEEELRRDLTDRIEAFERVHGEPVADPTTTVPVPVPTVPEKPTREVEESAPARPEVGGTSPDSSEDSAPSATSTTADRVLTAVGYQWTKPRVLRGTAAELVRQIVKLWVADRGHGDGDLPRLEGLAGDWVRAARDVLSRAPRDVVLALEAQLGRGTAPDGVPASQVSRLRSELMSVQQRVEARLPSAPRSVSTPTYLLFER